MVLLLHSAEHVGATKSFLKTVPGSFGAKFCEQNRLGSQVVFSPQYLVSFLSESTTAAELQKSIYLKTAAL